MPLSKILLPTITTTGIIAGSIITISNLSNTKIKLLDLKEKFGKLETKIGTPMWDKENSFYKEATEKNRNLRSKIDEITNLSKKTPFFKNPSNNSENQKKLKEIWKEINEIFQLLEKAEKIKI